MKYDLNTPIDRQRFSNRSQKLLKEGAFIELRKILPVRTNQQNKYLHVILSYFALEYGETLDYVKQVFFKKVVNESIFKTKYTNPQNGNIRDEWLSTSVLDTKQLTTAIDRFRDYASKEAGIYLPEPHEEEFLRSCEVEVSKNNWI